MRFIANTITIGLLITAACGPSPAFAPEREPAGGEWTPAPHDYGTPFELGQRWIGRTACHRGEILFSLDIVQIDGAEIRVIVEVENQRSKAESIFEASGHWIVESREFELTPRASIKLPKGESMFALRGQVTVSERRMMGIVEGCGGFYLRAVPSS